MELLHPAEQHKYYDEYKNLETDSVKKEIRLAKILMVILSPVTESFILYLGGAGIGFAGLFFIGMEIKPILFFLAILALFHPFYYKFIYRKYISPNTEDMKRDTEERLAVLRCIYKHRQKNKATT